MNITKGPNAQTSLGVEPPEATVQPGDRASYCITGAHDPGDLDVDGLPPHTSSSFSRGHGHGDGCIWLTVRTHGNTPVGDYPLPISAKGHHGQPSSVTAVLHVIGDSKPFTISGDLSDPLELGVPQALDLTLGNPNNMALTLHNVSVTIDHVDTAHSACSVADNFVVTQFSGPYDQVVMPGNGATSLSAAGIPSQYWPQIEWINTDFDQSACLGATLALAYTGTAVNADH